MSVWHNKSTDELCEALLALETKEECYAFLEDICTIREILDISQRLSIAKMFDDGATHAVIRDETGASAATISRIRKCWDYGTGGYKMIINKCKGKDDDQL